MQQDTEVRLAWGAYGDNLDTATLQKLINDYGLELGDVVQVGEVKEHGTDWIDAGDVIEMIADRGADEGGEYADDFPVVSTEAKAELAAFLSRWQAENCVAMFYRVVNIRQHTITESDLEEAACNRT